MGWFTNEIILIRKNSKIQRNIYLKFRDFQKWEIII